MYYFSGDTVTDRTIQDPLYDIPAGSSIQAGVPNTAYSPESGSFLKDVTNGAGANAPSENLSFYFSGKYNADGTAFNYVTPPVDYSPYLIQVDTTIQGHADWSRSDLTQSNITLRSEGGLVWVPTSSRGILVALGGVVYDADMEFYSKGANASELSTANSFLKEFPVYDIGSSQWYMQPLSVGSPVPQNGQNPLAQFCTVVASSPDGSHHEIFVYGGWDSNGGASSGEVWILTVPSFTWVRASTAGTRRQGHVCFKPYSDQMLVVGGTGDSGSGLNSNNSVDVFNLNSLSWTGTYDPDIHADYTPHPSVQSVISATPTASGMASSVANLFNNKYNMALIRSFGPYKAEVSTPLNTSTPTPTPAPHHSDRSWVVPVAVVVPIVVVGAILAGLLWFCWRKNKRRHESDMSASETAANRKSWIVPWIWSTTHGSQQGHKDTAIDESVTEVEHPHSPPAMVQRPQEMEAGAYFPPDDSTTRERWSHSTAVRSPRYDYAGPVEGMNTEVHEVHGSSHFNHPSDVNYDPKNMALYPPSIVSGGHSRTIPSSNLSDSGDSNVAVSSHGMASSGFAPIPEREMAGSGRNTPGLDRAISPIDLRRDRPSQHERNPSDVSSAPSLPSPNLEEDGTLSPERPTASRGISDEDIHEHRGG
jgi:hypothetical protein